MTRYVSLSSISLLLSLMAFGLEAASISFPGKDWVMAAILLSVPLLYLAEILLRLKGSISKSLFFRKNIIDFIVLVIVIFTSIYTAYLNLFREIRLFELTPLALIILRSCYSIVGELMKIKRFAVFVGEFSLHPAQAILLSFLAVILTGAVLLMLPSSTLDGSGLSPIDALFTSTSAVCVTGLIVVDTATVFTLSGTLIILFLIQIGGLGLMLISFFVIFSVRRSVSIEDKLLVSYMLNETDMSRLRKNLSGIVYITFGIEITGAIILFPSFAAMFGPGWKAVLYSVFHSISAFCNAGFALFSNSLEGFSGNPGVLLPMAVLIVTGGLSFNVIMSLFGEAKRFLRNKQPETHGRLERIPANTKIVLSAVFLLLVAGLFLTYALEHGNTLKELPVGTQYLNAFFQSVTYRTAGFNSIPFGDLRPAMYIIIIAFMFIGGASGSTAGGIKINTAAVTLGFIRSSFRNTEQVTLWKHTVSRELVTKSLLILVFGIGVVFTGATLLSITEKAPFLPLLFETVSAFGTVGLSAGVTPGLSVIGKIVISVIMFIGRLGPLTIVAAATVRKEQGIEYPHANVLIG